MELSLNHHESVCCALAKFEGVWTKFVLFVKILIFVGLDMILSLEIIVESLKKIPLVCSWLKVWVKIKMMFLFENMKLLWNEHVKNTWRTSVKLEEKCSWIILRSMDELIMLEEIWCFLKLNDEFGLKWDNFVLRDYFFTFKSSGPKWKLWKSLSFNC